MGEEEEEEEVEVEVEEEEEENLMELSWKIRKEMKHLQSSSLLKYNNNKRLKKRSVLGVDQESKVKLSHP